MTSMKEVLTELDTYSEEIKPPPPPNPGVVRSTLTHKYRGKTRSITCSATCNQPQEKIELVKYTKKSTKAQLPPEREMIQNFAAIIA